ncbi:MAG: FKBP-type peptidyl-prolyl cis-trans isomerase [Ardenticatenaceae bacterium]
MSKSHSLGPAAVTTDSGLMYEDKNVGDGSMAESGQLVEVHYQGFLKNGQMFDSSLRRGKPFEFPLGAGRVIRGWDEGIAGMKIGGRRTLVIPPDLGYGARGAGNVIPANATLIFEVQLLGVQEVPKAPESPAKVAQYETTSSGLEYAILAPGEGREAQANDIVVVTYTGWLENGTMFDSSIPRGEPLEFVLGRQQVISGWDEGVQGMKVGQKRQLRIPSRLAYGRRGAGNVIPPNATLIFDVELVKIH